MLWEGHRERAGFSCLLQAVHLILLQEPLLRARSRLSLVGQGSLPVSDVLSCVCSLSPFNVQGQKALSVGDLSREGVGRQEGTELPISCPVKDEFSLSSRCL